MRNQTTSDRDEHIDRHTSAAICNAIGERLRRDIGPECDALPSHLQALMAEFERQDRQEDR